MYWEEDKNTTASEQEIITDVSFSIRCRAVPLDHAYVLQQAITAAIPWLIEEPRAGIHNIHIQSEANGWFRPDNPDTDEVLLSKRSKLRIRIPVNRIDELSTLVDQTIQVAGNDLTFIKFRKHPLQTHAALFSRHIQLLDNETEEQMVGRIIPMLETRLDSRIRKVLCGKINHIRTPDKTISTQSLLIANLSKQDSKQLQEIGEHLDGGLLGCGLFIPHKGIEAVKETS